MKINEIMTTNVISVSKDSDVEAAIDLMVKHNVSGLPVTDEDMQVVGIITETDLVLGSKKIDSTYYYPSFFPLADSYEEIKKSKAAEKNIEKLLQTKVAEIMTTEVYVVEEEDSIDDVVLTMAEKEVHRVPVVSKGRLVGVISQRDVIKEYGRNAAIKK